MRPLVFLLALILFSCERPAPTPNETPTPTPTIAATPRIPAPHPSQPDRPKPKPTPSPTATPSPTPEPSSPPVFGLPPAHELTKAGEDLIIEQEGIDLRPEWPGAGSGATWGVGYDAHQNTVSNILGDWAALPAPAPKRLAATQPYYGKAAIAPTRAVHDILVPRQVSEDVFNRIDVSREFAAARRALPGFDDLRPNAQAALISLGFNRGWSMIGNNRVEMREIRRLVPSQDYAGMAAQFMKMRHVWDGTGIQHDMYMRRAAEAKLMLTP